MLGYLSILSIFLLTQLPKSQAYGAGNEVGQVETILDRLESRLLEMEGDSLGLPQGRDPFKVPDTPAISLKGSSKINGSLRESDNISAIAAAIAKLEHQVDQLNSDVQKTKQRILESAQLNNYIEMQAFIEETDLAAVKSISVKIDGYEVYSLQENSGVWSPAGKIPLYAGPLQPGTHQVQLDARIVMKKSEALPLNGDVYRFINKSFDILVPATNFRKRWLMKVIPPNSNHGQAKLDIVKSNLP